MKGLLAKPSLDGNDARDALRVVDYFDHLVQGRVSLPALVRAAAGLAECEVTWRRADGSLVTSHHGRGAAIPLVETRTEEDVEGCLRAEVTLDGQITLHRSGPVRALDGLLMERLVLAAATLGGRSVVSIPETRHWLMCLIDAATSSVARRDHALRLGLDPELGIRVITRSHTSGRTDGEAAPRQRSDHRGAERLTVRLGPHDVTLSHYHPTDAMRRNPEASLPTGLAHCENLDDLPRAVTDSRTAYRFALAGVDGPRTGLVEHQMLGLLARLLDPAALELKTHPDVEVIARLAAASSEVSPSDLDVLEAVCRAASQREAAVELHLHHSTVAARVQRLGRRSGWKLNAPAERQRARLALLGYRLTQQEAT